MKDNFYHYPPYLYLTQLADHCPKAVSTYMLLWRNIDKENKVNVFKKDIRSEHLITLNKFSHDLLLLVKEGLVSLEETPNWFHIELVGWDNEEAEYKAC